MLHFCPNSHFTILCINSTNLEKENHLLTCSRSSRDLFGSIQFMDRIKGTGCDLRAGGSCEKQIVGCLNRRTTLGCSVCNFMELWSRFVFFPVIRALYRDSVVCCSRPAQRYIPSTFRGTSPSTDRGIRNRTVT